MLYDGCRLGDSAVPDREDQFSGDTTLFRSGGWHAAPHRLGQYDIRRVIDAGGMGTVYEAMQQSPRRIVALKVMRPGLTSPSAWRRFLNESQILARLHHPGIAQVYEAGTHDEGGASIPFFAMEFVPGAMTIIEYARSRSLDTTQKLELFAQVCDAVHHGHSKGIIHRDLKPANILVDSSGRLKIIDFGVARATDADLVVTTQQTSAGDLVGTVQYMSPEQVAGDARDIDPRSDVYSLGVVLYELLAGRPPHDLAGKPVTEALRIIREETPQRISRMDPSLRSDIESIVHAALQKDRVLRFQTADDFRQNIQRYLRDEPLSIRKPSLGYVARTQARSFVRRHRLVALLGAAAAGALLAEFVGVPLVHQWTPANRFYAQLLGDPAAASDERLKHVQVIQITQPCLDQADEIANDLGLQGVNNDESSKSLRRLYGRAMERLAAIKTRCVVWDTTFIDPTEFDDDLARGMQAISDAGGACVISVRQWPINGSLDGIVAPGIAGHTLAACPSGHFNKVLWMHIVAAQRGISDPVPSLALLGVAGFLHPRAEIGLSISDFSSELVMKFYEYPDPQQPARRQQIDDVLRLPLTSVEQVIEGDSPDGLEPGDIVANYQVAPPSDAVIDSSSMTFAQMMRASDAQLREALDSKVVLIGRTLPGKDDYATPDGRNLHGVYAHAAGIEAILGGGNPVMIERTLASRSVLGACALVGAMLAGLWLGRPGLRAGALGLVAMLMVASSALIFHRWLYFLSPIVPLFALFTAFGIGTLLLHLVQRDSRARTST